jgi:hypothetical protein
MRWWLPPRQARAISLRDPCPRHATTPPRSSPPPGPPDHCPLRWAAIGAPAVWPDVFPSGRRLTDRTARCLGARCGAGPRAHLAFGAREPPAGMPRRNSGAACHALSGPRPARIRHTWLVSRRWLPHEQDTTFSSVTNRGAKRRLERSRDASEGRPRWVRGDSGVGPPAAALARYPNRSHGTVGGSDWSSARIPPGLLRIRFVRRSGYYCPF